MGITGLGQLDKMRAVVLTLPRLMSRASTDAADLLEDAIEAQFDAGVDPYGEPWKSLAPSTLKRGRTPPPGTDTGALRAVEVTPMQSAGIQVTFPEEYAVYFDAKRPIIPREGDFNRSSWYPPIVEAYSNAMLKNGGWRAAGADEEPQVFDHAAE